MSYIEIGKTGGLQRQPLDRNPIHPSRIRQTPAG